jgi:signal transduction histidine kinase
MLAYLIFATIYFIAGRLGQELSYANATVSAVWPPTGLAIAALLLLGSNLWPGILLGGLLIEFTTGGSLLIGTGVAVGNTLEALAAAFLVTTFAHGRWAFERPRDVVRFVGLAALLSPMVSATVGVMVHRLVGAAAWTDLGSIWLTWWLADAAGALLVAPLLIVWGTPATNSWRQRRFIEAAALFLTLILASLVVFGGILAGPLNHYPIQFLVVPPLIWAGYRFGPRGAATAIFVLAMAATWGTLHRFGPFASETLSTSLLLVQAFLGVMAAMTLMLAASVVDQERAREGLRASEERRANEAEAARDQLQEFVGMVVHDLRNPLTAALGYTQLVRRQVEVAEGSAGQATLNRIERSLRTMRRRVEDLLDSTRLGGGRFVISDAPTDLSELVKQAVEEQQNVGVEHRLVIEGMERLIGSWDADRLRQVVVNLLSNACKYSPAGTEVRVKLRATDATVLLSVSDQGVGIDPEHLGQLFQPFARLGQERTVTGTGLGLYITKGIVEAHGGRIWVESSAGQGSTFYVELPCQAGEEEASGNAAA